jgi:hypothetical protein
MSDERVTDKPRCWPCGWPTTATRCLGTDNMHNRASAVRLLCPAPTGNGNPQRHQPERTVSERETPVVEQDDDELLSIRQLRVRLRELVLEISGRLVATVAPCDGRDRVCEVAPEAPQVAALRRQAVESASGGGLQVRSHRANLRESAAHSTGARPECHRRSRLAAGCP